MKGYRCTSSQLMVAVGTGLILAAGATAETPRNAGVRSTTSNNPVVPGMPAPKGAVKTPGVIVDGGVAGAPSNDSCASPLFISEGTTPIDTFGATTDGPAHGACLFFGDSQVGSDIWFTYIAGGTGSANFSMCGSGYDTKLAVYSGAICPIDDSALLGCNDDFCGLQSQLSLPVTAGSTYTVRVGGYNGAQGTGSLTISLAGPLANDACDDRLPVFDGATPFDTTGATTDGSTHAACNFFGDPDVGSDIWYNYTATTTGTTEFSLCGSFYDTKIAVYNGCTCPALEANLLACNDDSCGLQSRVQVETVAGSCYKVRVGGYAGSTGQGTLTIGPFVSPCPNPKHDCATQGGPGCSDEACCNTVCAIDPFCCDTAWDGICVDEADQFCGAGCDLTCPAGSIDEAEACGTDTNGGCNSTPQMSLAIPCDSVICGTWWAQGGTRDTDWFTVTLANNNTTVEVIWTSEFPGFSFIVDLDCFTIHGGPADADCPGEETVASALLNAGTYYVVGVPGSFDGLPCGGTNNDWYASVECTLPCPADVTGDGFVNVNDLLVIINAWGNCPD